MKVGLILISLLLQMTVTSGNRISVLNQHQFQKESCYTQLHDDITWFHADTKLLLTNGHISRLHNCQITAKQSVGNEAQIIAAVSTDQILLCSTSGQLYQTNPDLSKLTLVTQSSDYYKSKSVCSIGGELTAAVISNNLYLYSNSGGSAKLIKYLPESGSLVKSGVLKTSSSANSVNLIFQHGSFVYTIYTGESGEGRVTRVCENDEGNYGSFATERHGALSCSVMEMEHTVLLDVQYDSANSRLLLLTSRTPVTLSGRVLCAIPIVDIDSKLDTGRFLDYDEMGRERGTLGSRMNCNQADQNNYLTQLLDLIQGTDNLLSDQRNYNSFRNIEKIWYFTADGELDIWKEKHDGTLSKIQAVQTNMNPARLLLSSSGQLSLLSSHKIALLPKFFCSHIKDPVECYQGPPCSWSEENWNCTLSTEKRTLTDEYPAGITRKLSKLGGCAIETEIYTEHGKRVAKNIVSCPVPTLPKNTEPVSLNSTCLGLVTVQCAPGSDLTSGDLVRQCLPTGKWSGAPPICTQRHCPVLTPSPGSYISTFSTAVGTTLTTSCADPCHVTSHPNPLHCLDTGRWNGSLPTCSPATCYPLPLPKNTIRLYDQRKPTCGGQFAVGCVEGTDLVYGDTVRTCQKDGTWSGQVPLCTVTQCPVFPPPKHGSLSSSSRRVGALVTVTCNACHRVEGVPGLSLTVSAQCLSSGRWSIEPPSCERVTCPPLFSTTGVNMISLNTSCIGVAEFQCATGYTLHSGTFVRYCQPDGKWSGVPPLCVPETCPPLKFTIDDRVVVLRRGQRYGERSVMKCQTESTLQSGQLDLVCLAGGMWSGDKPRCKHNFFIPTSANLTNPDAPEPVASTEEDDNTALKVVAVIGWVLFAMCIIFIVLVVVLVRRGRLHNLYTGKDNKTRLERQVTTSTTLGVVGTLDLRKSRILDPDSITPTYSTNSNLVTPTYSASSNLVTPVTPTYRIYDTPAPQALPAPPAPPSLNQATPSLNATPPSHSDTTVT